MGKAVGALVAFAVVILGASIVAQQQAAPAPSAPIPAGLPEWAYTPPPPPGGPPPSALPAGDAAVVSIPRDHQEVHARAAPRAHASRYRIR
jgi:hypothetical protein